MEVSVLTLEHFRRMVREKYSYNNISLTDKIHYFHYSDLDTFFASESYIEHLRFIVAYDEKDILGACKFSYYDLSKEYGVSYISTNVDHKNKGVGKAITKKLFQFFKENYPTQTLGLSGYSISGWKYLRKYIVEYSQELQVPIKEKPIEYITEWTDENRKLFDESREIIKPLY